MSAVGRNQSRGQSDVGLFEVGARFFGGQPGEQEMVAGGLRVGHNHERHWAAAPRPVDVFDARADALAVLAACKVKPTRSASSPRGRRTTTPAGAAG